MSPTTITLIFLAFAVVMFVTEKIPLAVTSMIYNGQYVVVNDAMWDHWYNGKSSAFD